MLGQEADHQLPEEGEELVLVASVPLPQVPSIDSLDKGITYTIYINIYSLPGHSSLKDLLKRRHDHFFLQVPL